uniref:Uncharacterized protein n=1 Tax=Mucochytrium quahogii TaxID=96639 RepID=A0A7S2RRX2_9STRA|mmetsp:Transcript_26340/g.42667  ORF Transcript_26340/g.42667 Transcript_26340/m.42667 type:complete len:547 (+) Transcript_26340:64-1704(+)
MVLRADEAERAIESLHELQVSSVGESGWMKQHVLLQKLNLQAHESVQANADNFVLELLVTHDKLTVVLHELLVIEAWREKVLANEQVRKHLAKSCSIRGYHAAYQEGAICNLLEVVLYHDYAALACGDMLIELVDYCCRRVRWLCEMSIREGDGEQHGKSLSGDDNYDDFNRQLDQLALRCAIASVSILRFLCEHIKELPLGVMTRMIDTHDVPCLIIPLIENPPWTRRKDDGIWEKLVDHKWAPVPPQDLLLLTPLEAQPWLILFNLLCEGEVRKRYHFHSFRKDNILRVRKYLNLTLVDQLPVLADLQRTLDELLVVNAPAASSTSTFVMEQVAEVRENLMRNTNWNKEIETAITKTFAKESADDPIIQQLAGMYGDENIEQLLSGNTVSEDGVEIEPAEVIEKDKPVKISPKSATLLLQSGQNIELVSLTDVGTEQETSKGQFFRYQLHSKLGSENSGTSLNVSVPSIEPGSSQVLKMIVVTSDGAQVEIFSAKPMKLDPSKSEFWHKLGSLKDGLLAQIQCSYNSETSALELESVFVSIRNS